MTKHAAASTLIDMQLDRKARTPLHRQLYSQIRDLIVDGRLPSGSSLPSSRAVASTFGVSRSTVVVAFEQLALEGFICGRVGDATRVAEVTLKQSASAGRIARTAPPRPLFSRRGSAL